MLQQAIIIFNVYSYNVTQEYNFYNLRTNCNCHCHCHCHFQIISQDGSTYHDIHNTYYSHHSNVW